MRYDTLKRVADLAVGVPLFVVTLPIQAAAALAILGTMGRPVLFTQTRPGLNGEPFEMRKFRTMHPENPARGWTDDASRLTPVGRFLRSTSIDELPTIWNIVQGNLSLVGPRPLLMRYLDRYTPEQARRMEVRPGLTGLAQVSGRNALTWEERFAYDVEYVDNRSLLLDLKILWRTVVVVLRRDGVSANDHVTMPEFYGTQIATGQETSS